MWEELTEKAEVLIVAKCNVNSKEFIESFLKKFVLIVAKCNVNYDECFLLIVEILVLIVAKCNVNILSTFPFEKLYQY